MFCFCIKAIGNGLHIISNLVINKALKVKDQYINLGSLLHTMGTIVIVLTTEQGFSKKICIELG